MRERMNKNEIEKLKQIIQEVEQEAKDGWGIAPYDWGVIDDILHTVVYRLEIEMEEGKNE